jgi:polysaccharide export outer membrane protein
MQNGECRMMNCTRSTSRGSGHLLTFSILHFSFCLAALAACSSSPPVTQNPAPAPTGIRPGDVVKVDVWREPDYTREYLVDPRGTVNLPQLGLLRVAGKSPDWLSDTITAGYRRVLANPTITVTVGLRVTVSGEVGRPGLLTVDPTTTVGDLLALAGGPTPLGNRNKIQLVRNGRVIVTSLDAGTVLQRSPVQSGDQLIVPRRGWMARNGQYFINGAISVASAVTVALLVRR